MFFCLLPLHVFRMLEETSETYLFFQPIFIQNSRYIPPTFWILQFQTLNPLILIFFPRLSQHLRHLRWTGNQEMIQPKLHSALSMVAPVDINPCLLGDRAPQMDEARWAGGGLQVGTRSMGIRKNHLVGVASCRAIVVVMIAGLRKVWKKNYPLIAVVVQC